MKGTDAKAVAVLHTESWRNTYRDILRDAYLKGPIEEERLSTWATRLERIDAGTLGLIAHREEVPVGFAYAFVGRDARLGTLLDNLHVKSTERGRGVGTMLLRELTALLLGRCGDGGLFLEVYEDNVRTRAYYERLGAVKRERRVAEAPDGSSVAEWVYVWDSVAGLNDVIAHRQA